jgi:DNA primase
VEEILKRLQGPVIPNGRGGHIGMCPCHQDVKPSLCIDEDEETGCTLVKCMAGCETTDVMEAIGLPMSVLFKNRGAAPPARPGKRPLLVSDLELRHAAYSALLDQLPLTEAHSLALARRGLGPDAIRGAGYRSLSFLAAKRAAKALRERFGPALSRVPGFSGDPLPVTRSDGILIPVRTREGLIQALQVRTAEKFKYLWLSSSAASSGTPVHVPLGVPELVPGRAVRVTEGPLKADVAFHLSGVPTLGVASVTAWKASLAVLRDLGATEVEIAFDMDRKTKDGVAGQLADYRLALGREGFKASVLTWPEEHKGLDDWLLAERDA